MDRLQKVLELLNYKQTLPRHHRGNLLSAIELFAALNEDHDLESACAIQFEKIVNEK